MRPQIIAAILALSFLAVAQANSSQEKAATTAPVHYPWMDEMRKQGLKRALVWIDIRFHRNGHPKEIKLDHIEYFTEYAGGTAISDSEHLDAIRATELEGELKRTALEKARNCFWIIDVPRPRPHPFIGGTQVEFLDDERLTIPGCVYHAK